HRTGTIISVNLVCGRPGPVSIHTPDVCYGASGFTVADPIKFQPKSGFECWTAEAVQKKATEQTRLRLFWTWNAGGKWQASGRSDAVPGFLARLLGLDSPRIAFASYPVLYKLYLARELAVAGEPLDSDPCVEFLDKLLPELQKALGAPGT